MYKLNNYHKKYKLKLSLQTVLTQSSHVVFWKSNSSRSTLHFYIRIQCRLSFSSLLKKIDIEMELVFINIIKSIVNFHTTVSEIKLK